MSTNPPLPGPQPQPGGQPYPGYPAGPLPPAPMYRPTGSGNSAYGCFFALSVFLNLGLLVVVVLGCMGAMFSGIGGSGELTTLSLTEKVVSGSKSDKIAIIELEGVIMEGALTYVHKQIEQAARDKSVKGVVLRINSPGGSITASDDLYRRLKALRDGGPTLADGTIKSKHEPKKLVVSMASLAASGGYYVALPAELIFAERTTMTGSIGVYASFPNVAGLAKKWEVDWITIKAGDIKDSGSMFKEMSAKERAVWQSMIDQAYIQFTDLVSSHRKNLKYTPTEKFDYKVATVPGVAPEQPVPANLQRNIADGGIWTAKEALELKIVDRIGALDDAVSEVRNLAGLDENAKVIRYERQKTFSEVLLGAEAKSPSSGLSADKLSRAVAPRLWYLMPGADLSGILAALED